MKRAMATIGVVMMTAAAAMAGGGAALAQDTRLSGMIVAHDGATIVVRGAAGDTAVALTETTQIRGTSGMLGVRGEDHPASDLIPGLAVEVDTAQGAAGVTATQVTFKNSDLKTARQISAGLAGPEKRITENAAGIAETAERLDKVGELVAAGRTRVFFDTGSSDLSPASKASLDQIAAQARALPGPYRVAVVGRADTTGNAAANERLSAVRAMAVRNYLIRSGGIMPDKFIPVTALGSAPVANDPDPPKTDAEARRVTVTLAVSGSARE